MSERDLTTLRRVINENLRVQRGGADPVPYIDVSNVLGDVSSRQNHTVFGRRGCGKTLLLQHSASRLPADIKPVYLNCEDFKKHSFPNVLIEILDALFGELEKHLGGWFGRKKRSRAIISDVRKKLGDLRLREDQTRTTVRASETMAGRDVANAKLSVGTSTVGVGVGANLALEDYWKRETERHYELNEDKIRELDTWCLGSP